MTTEDHITFRLRFFCRFDEEVQAYVAYIPRLQIYAQTPVERDLKKAVRKTALRFILTCADMRILDDIMHESRMKEISADEAESLRKDETAEFVSVKGYKECDSIELTLPLPLTSDTLATLTA